MRLTTILRLGLRQFAAGLLSVLTLGILNRVMKVEMGLDLTLVSIVISAHYFAAPLAVPLGHRSDTRPYFVYHRSPYILAGAAITALTTALAPFVAFLMEAQRGSLLSALVGLGLFLTMGVGMFMAGTAYLSLIADLTTEAERGKVTGIVWAMLMFGILAGVFLGTRLLAQYTPQDLVTLFLTGAVILIALTLIAIWGLEKPRPELHAQRERSRRNAEGPALSVAEGPRAALRPSGQAVSLKQAVAVLGGSGQVRVFFGFLLSGIFFLFVQQVVLEPFGGDVFGLSVRETTLFNAYQMVGVLAGMGLGGAWLTRQIGQRQTAALGALVAAASFGWLALAALLHQASWLTPAILLMGLGMGAFTIAGIALMMGMTVGGHAGLYMGAWTLAEATARGLAGASGGVLFDLAQWLGASAAGAYAAVFALEGAGMLLTLALLVKVDPVRFRAESALAAGR